MLNANISGPRGAMSVNEFAVWAGIGRTTAWKEIREGRLCAVKVSARTIVRLYHLSMQEFVESGSTSGDGSPSSLPAPDPAAIPSGVNSKRKVTHRAVSTGTIKPRKRKVSAEVAAAVAP